MGEAPIFTPKDSYSSDPTRWSRISGRDRKITSGASSQPKGALTAQKASSISLLREDIVAILLEARKVESSAYIDIRTPYLEEMTRKPYPTNYTPPIFSMYDGVVGNAKEHTRRYVDALTTYFHDHELRLGEFSKFLEGRAFT